MRELLQTEREGRCVVLTLTLHACVVQGEAFTAFTVEAPRRVDTRGPGTTAAVLSGTLIVV